MRQIGMALIVFICALTCACTITIRASPDWRSPPQPAIKVDPPIVVGVIDHDGDGSSRDPDYTSKLSNQIAGTYPAAMVAGAPGASSVGRVVITVHINRLGATSISGKDSTVREKRALEGFIGEWAGVIASVDLKANISSGRVYEYQSTNWSGVTDLAVEVNDTRPGHAGHFTVPFVSERFRPNIAGVFDASSAGWDAWDSTVPRVAAFLQAVVVKVQHDAKSQRATPSYCDSCPHLR